MKSRTVIILWLLAIVLGISAYFVKFHSKEDEISQTKLAAGDPLFVNLPIGDIYSVELSQGKFTTHLQRGEGNQWGVKERQNYTVNYELLRDLLGSLNELDVTQAYSADKKYHERFGLSDAPFSDEAGFEHSGALRVSMLEKDGSPLAEVYLGKTSGGNRITGRFVRITGDETSVYAVTQTFPGVTANPKDWLNRDFLKLSLVKSIHLAAPADPDFEHWTLTRPNEQKPFTLLGMKENEVMQLTSTNALRGLFTYSAHQDLLDEKQAAALSLPDTKLQRRATITAFDGITYRLDFWPQLPLPKDPNADPRLPAPPPSYNLKIQVSADLAQTRAKSADENPEDTARLDQEFAQNLQATQNKVTDAKNLEGFIFQVSKNLIAPLEKKRSDFVKAIPTTQPSAIPQAPIQPAPRQR